MLEYDKYLKCIQLRSDYSHFEYLSSIMLLIVTSFEIEAYV